jgi:serine/threonine-protein kinase
MYPTSAPTRGRSPGVAATRTPALLAPGDTIVSPDTGLEYRIERLLGAGGFGQVFLASRRGRSSAVPSTLCIKVSPHIDGWIREAYFGQLLAGHDRAMQIFDRFPVVRDGRTVYCLALEYAPHGDLSAFLARSEKRWSETAVRREIAGVLEVLAKLHRGQALHRDLTPMNVFVTDRFRLKLGDFGIVRQQSDSRGITARTMNQLTAPSEILARTAPKWQARDDVFQVGQLLGMLLKGDARERIRPHEVRGLACTDHLKEILYRCIGERRKRYESADEMIAALRNPPLALQAGVVRSLDGVHLAFTGILRVHRRDAVRAAKKAGAIVHGAPSSRTTVVVRGRPNPLQAAGRDGGLKLMEIKRLREKGYRITLLDEARFWRLAGGQPRRRRPGRPSA